MTMKITMRLSIRLIYQVKEYSIQASFHSWYCQIGKWKRKWWLGVCGLILLLNYNVALHHCSLSLSLSFIEFRRAFVLALSNIRLWHKFTIHLSSRFYYSYTLLCRFTPFAIYSHLMKFLIVLDFVAVLVWIKLLLHIIELCTL